MKHAIFYLLITLCLFGCKKEDDHPDSYFTIADKTGVTPYGYIYPAGHSVDLWSISHSDNRYNGEIHYVSLGIDSLVDNGEYTYLASVATGFNNSKNFPAATVILAGQAHGADPVTLNPDSMLLQDVTDGHISVSKNGNIYTIKYTLLFGDVQVSGVYKGVLERY